MATRTFCLIGIVRTLPACIKITYPHDVICNSNGHILTRVEVEAVRSTVSQAFNYIHTFIFLTFTTLNLAFIFLELYKFALGGSLYHQNFGQ